MEVGLVCLLWSWASLAFDGGETRRSIPPGAAEAAQSGQGRMKDSEMNN